MSEIVRALSADGSVVVSAVNSTQLVSEIAEIHKCSAVVTAGLGRLATGACLMANSMKSDSDSMTVRISGDGPAKSWLAVANNRVEVKAYPQVAVVDIPLNNSGKLDVGGAIGRGYLDVIKDTGMKQPYVGRVATVSGEVAEDITSYFATSEQQPTVCGLGVLVNRDLTVKSAGGFLLQLLPFADPTVIDLLEENINKLPPVSNLFETHTPHEAINRLLEGMEPNILDVTPCKFLCDCSRERVKNALVTLGKDELESLETDDKPTEVHCHFCNKTYGFSKEELREMASKIS